MSISVLILTLNEEKNISRCLASLAWSDDVVILDSFSEDGTGEIARQAQVRFVQRAFQGYADQRNYGLNDIQYRHPWVLMVDADEIVPPELVRELKVAVANAAQDVCLFQIRRKDFLMGRWIRRSSGYPTWFGRLMRVGRVWVEREINEEFHTDGWTARLNHHLHHYPFNKGFAAWIEKHNRYSTMEAHQRLASAKPNIPWSQLFAQNPQLRRTATKALYYSLPLRPLVAFVSLYILRGGILEGRPGFVFSVLRSCYEFMIDVKVIELRLRDKGLPL